MLFYLASNLTVAELARQLGVSPNTVKTQLKGVYRKLEVNSREAATERPRPRPALSARPLQEALAGDDAPTCTAHRLSRTCRPRLLPHDHRGRGVRLDHFGGDDDVVAQEAAHIAVEVGEPSQPGGGGAVEGVELEQGDVAIPVLGDEHDVEQPDGVGLDQVGEGGSDLTVEAVAGELDDDVLDPPDRAHGCCLLGEDGPLTLVAARVMADIRPPPGDRRPVAASASAPSGKAMSSGSTMALNRVFSPISTRSPPSTTTATVAETSSHRPRRWASRPAPARPDQPRRTSRTTATTPREHEGAQPASVSETVTGMG